MITANNNELIILGKVLSFSKGKKAYFDWNFSCIGAKMAMMTTHCFQLIFMYNIA
jgi:hypothetical protein